MAELKVTFRLSESDVRHLRSILRKVKVAADAHSEDRTIGQAEEMVATVRAADPPTYILERIDRLEELIGMLKDKGWPMPAGTRQTAIGALAYLVDPRDLIPDHIPGLGFLDDAIMIELVVGDLRHEIDGYVRFRRFRHTEWERPWYRQSPESRAARIEARRRQIRARIRERTTRDRTRTRAEGRTLRAR